MGPDRGADRAPYWRAQAIAGWAQAFRAYVEGKSQLTFGCSSSDLFADDAAAWYGVMWAWLAEGFAAGTFRGMHAYDERVRWGTEMKPDLESWGMDPSTTAAAAIMDAVATQAAGGGTVDEVEQPEP